MRVVGLSGGIACGKSTVSRLLQARGLPVIDCDEIAKQVVRKGRWGWRRVVAAFGPAVLQADGELDRQALAQLVFGDAAARRRLNAATHLPVAAELLRLLLWHWLSLEWLVVVDMPLLFETGTYRYTRPNVLVACSPGVQLQRLMQRDGLDEAAAVARVAAQMPLEAKRRLMAPRPGEGEGESEGRGGGHVLLNDGDPGELVPQVDRLVLRLRKGAAAWGLVTSPLAAVLLLGVAVTLAILR